MPAGQVNVVTDADRQPRGANYTLTMADFPFHRLSNPLDRNSDVLFDSPDVVSSQGVFATEFISSTLRKPLDSCTPVEDPNFMVASIQTRRVEPRNTPTAIGAAFNFRNFWDGRANNRFNGANPFGRRDATAGVWKADKNGKLTLVRVDLPTRRWRRRRSGLQEATSRCRAAAATSRRSVTRSSTCGRWRARSWTRPTACWDLPLLVATG